MLYLFIGAVVVKVDARSAERLQTQIFKAGRRAVDDVDTVCGGESPVLL